MNCSCTWTKDPETETPYLCIAGRDAKVKVYDVIEGKLVKVRRRRNLSRVMNSADKILGTGRSWRSKSCWEPSLVPVTYKGQEINDLATSPTNFLHIATASDDTTVRIWSLDPKDAKQPCVALLAGEGHSSHLLTVVCLICNALCDLETNRPRPSTTMVDTFSRQDTTT